LVEQRLEIRVHGERLAVTMRTPSNDNELAPRVNVNAPQEKLAAL
jgi:hypothetical protein